MPWKRYENQLLSSPSVIGGSVHTILTDAQPGGPDVRGVGAGRYPDVWWLG